MRVCGEGGHGEQVRGLYSGMAGADGTALAIERVDVGN